MILLDQLGYGEVVAGELLLTDLPVGNRMPVETLKMAPTSSMQPCEIAMGSFKMAMVFPLAF